jgi:chemotaxis signal transduction protein
MSAPANAPTLAVTDLVGELRTAFDRSFAEPPRRQIGDVDELLALRAGDRRFALRLNETAGLFPDRPVTALRGPVPALLGLAGFSGAIVPVYDLAAVLGHPRTDAGSPRWLVVAAGTPPLALAFSELEGHLRVPVDTIVAEADGQGVAGALHGMVLLPGGTRPIIDVPAVRSAVHALIGSRTSD